MTAIEKMLRKMRHNIFLVLAFICHLCAYAQKLTIENMAAAPMDLTASQYERKDLAGKLKVTLCP